MEEARLALKDALGENSAAYFKTLKAWFKSSITKADFDRKAFKLLCSDLTKMKLHNEFMLTIVTKCQIRPTPPPVFNPKPSRKRPNKSSTSFHARLPSTELLDIGWNIDTPPVNIECGSSVENGVLPDLSCIHGTCLLYCWHNKLTDVDAQVTSIVWLSVRSMLLNVIESIVQTRRAYSTTNMGLNHSYGSSKRVSCYPKGIAKPRSPIDISELLTALRQRNPPVHFPNSILIPFLERISCLLDESE